MTSALLTPAALNALNTVKILDASYGVPDAPGAFARAHIGNAQFFDIDAIADPRAPYPHTLPAPDDFGKAAGALGIGNDDEVVIYDQTGISFAAARAWWMFRVMGHERVRVLNGGLPAWIAAGLPTQSGPAAPPAAKTFTAHFRPDLYRSFEETEGEPPGRVIDARGAARFTASARDPDGAIMPAHIPGSINIPFQNLLDAQGALRPAADIAPALLPHIAPDSRLVASCGSGVTACVLALAFHEAGYADMAVYDGSWTEWADRNGLR